jgi:cytochrome c553
MRPCRIIWTLVLLASPLTASPQQVPADHAERLAKGTELFKQQIRGILTARCLNCHGGEKTRSDFDMSTRETLLQEINGQRVVVPFDHAKSKLYKLISHQDKPFMPHKGDKLPDKEIALLAQWIDFGAPYDRPLLDKVASGKKPMVVTDKDRQYWAFQPLKPVSPPDIKDAAWCKTAIDRFILATLQEKGLTPEADRSPARQPALRREVGAALARHRPLCRVQRLRA